MDAGTAAGRSLLTSFVWPFDLDRHVRLASALAVAASHPLHIDQTAASDWLPKVLATADPDTLPVVWHSITQLYCAPTELAAVGGVLNHFGGEHRLAEVSMEFDLSGPRDAKPELRTRLWDPEAPGSPRQPLLGTAHDHGIPVRLMTSGSAR